MHDGGRLDTENFVVPLGAGGTFQHGLSMAVDPAWQGSCFSGIFVLNLQVER
jgi:hypothetical protein